MTVTDTITLTDGTRTITATRSPDPAAAVRNLFTASDGLDGGLDAESTKTARAGDGEYQSGWRRPGRELTITGVWLGPGETEARAWLDTLTALGATGATITATRTTTANVRWCTCRLDGAPKLTPVIEDDWARIDWELPLYAADPHLYGADRSVQVRTAGADYGLVWPLYEPDGDALSWGSEAPAGTGSIANTGSVEAWPTARVVGNSASGFELTDGGGRRVVYRGPVSMAAPVVLDFAAGAATAPGGDTSELVTGRGWWSVPPGGAVTPTVRALQAGTTVIADITCYDTYL